MRNESPADLADGVLAGHRGALAKAITLTESTRLDHREESQEVMDRVLGATGKASRIGISGTPGVGKSTFIEAFGMELLERGHRVAVLAVDPSSQTTGGSILGDKTRMVDLNRSDHAFIRPSPSRGTLGGVTLRSRDAVLLCEAAGYDMVLVETVGVGQSETAVSRITDLFVLLIGPGGGDDLQGIKRGVMELADLIVVNKADGSMKDAAELTAESYRSALHLVRSKWAEPTEVITTSALDRSRVKTTTEDILRTWQRLSDDGSLTTLRQSQADHALATAITDLVQSTLEQDSWFSSNRQRLEDEVRAGRVSVTSAAAELSRRLLAGSSGQLP